MKSFVEQISLAGLRLSAFKALQGYTQAVEGEPTEVETLLGFGTPRRVLNFDEQCELADRLVEWALKGAPGDQFDLAALARLRKEGEGGY